MNTIDVEAGCPECGTLTSTHTTDCPRFRQPTPVLAVWADQCQYRLPGHHHCKHGHGSDCPDIGECEWVD